MKRRALALVTFFYLVSPSAEAQDGATEATLPLKHEVVDTPLTQGEGASE